MRRRLAGLVILMFLGGGMQASAQVCKDGQLSLTDALVPIESRAREAARELGIAQARPNPRAAKQVQAPSGATADASPVDNPSLPEILALAIDNDLLDLSEKQAFSASLNLAALAALIRPGVADDINQYRQYSWLRKVDGKLTLGGKGEALDRDGDGKPDEALRAKELSDSVSWEVRVRVWGSRDRREEGFEERFNRQILDRVEAEVEAYATFIRTHWFDKGNANAEDGCMPKDRLAAFLATPELQKELAALGGKSLEAEGAIDGAIKDLDRSLVVTLFASGTRREAELGPDKTGFGLRAGWGRGLLDHTFNVDWTKQEGLLGAPDARVTKLGYQAGGEIQGAGFEGSKLSLFGAWERYSNVPSAKHRTVAKAGGKLEIKLADGLTLPVSLTWANHRDLLTDAGDVVGNVAIALDLSDLRKAKRKALP